LIDELSMVGAEKLYQIHQAIAKRMEDSSKPFGHVNVITLGNFSQLEPVGNTALLAGIKETDTEVNCFQMLPSRIQHSSTHLSSSKNAKIRNRSTCSITNYASHLRNLRYASNCMPPKHHRIRDPSKPWEIQFSRHIPLEISSFHSAIKF
jgi:hypothetical protein